MGEGDGRGRVTELIHGDDRVRARDSLTPSIARGINWGHGAGSFAAAIDRPLKPFLYGISARLHGLAGAGLGRGLLHFEARAPPTRSSALASHRAQPDDLRTRPEHFLAQDWDSH